MKLHCRLGDSFIDVWLTNGPDQEQQIGRLDFSREPDADWVRRSGLPWRVDVSVKGERIKYSQTWVKHPPALYGDENTLATLLKAAETRVWTVRDQASDAMMRACSASAELAGWKMMAELQKVVSK